jgi:hypothetical protein
LIGMCAKIELNTQKQKVTSFLSVYKKVYFQKNCFTDKFQKSLRTNFALMIF